MKFPAVPRLVKLFSAARPNYALLLLAGLFLIVTETFPFLYPLLLKHILDALHEGVNLKHYALIYAGILAVHTLLLYLKTFFGVLISADATYTLREKLINRINSISLIELRQYTVGNWISRLTADMDVLGAMFRDGILELASNTLLLSFSIIFMFWQEPRLAAFTMIFLPVMVWFTHRFRRRIQKRQRDYRQRLASLTSYVQEVLQAIPLMQVFGKYDFLTRRFTKEQTAYRYSGVKWAQAFAAYFPLIQSFSDLSLIACYAGGLWWISQGSLSVGTLVAFVWVASIYTRPLRDLSNRINQVQVSLVAGERILDALEVGAPQEFGSAPFTPQTAAPAVEFCAVDFAYEPDKPVLHQASFSIPPQTFCAIAGKSGQGKSTILHLLSRLYTPTSGAIRIFGQNSAAINPTAWQNLTTYIAQDPFLFAGSIKENILLGAEFHADRFAQALQQARVTGILRTLPQGIDTLVGAQGVEVSRGQRQLIACARAFYRDPQLLLFDEPVASVDSVTEQLLQAALEELRQDRTAIVVSHRNTTLQQADLVVFLEQNKTILSGKHAELLQISPEYAEMFS